MADVPRGRILSASSDEQTKEAIMMKRIASSDDQTKGVAMTENSAPSDKQTIEAALKYEISQNHSDPTLGNSPGKRSESVREGVKVIKII